MTDPTRTPEPQETQHLPQETQHLPHEAQHPPQIQHPPQVQHLPQSKWERAMPTPQDAPRWPPTEPEARPEVTYLPRPTGPNWGLVLMGFALVVVAAGVFANQASGFQVSQLAGTGPGVLVGVGLLFALMGIVGMVGRRRH